MMILLKVGNDITHSNAWFNGILHIGALPFDNDRKVLGVLGAYLSLYHIYTAVPEGTHSMIDITFDFRSDSKGKYPDTYSPTLNAFHRALWSKELSNGELMELQSRGAPFVLTWKDFCFTSDTMIVEMRSQKNIKIIVSA